ncbi:hypothetical protein [Alicyclobacillus macrosporangiidus]|uniref:Ribbon-helix-helix protein, copG family n=1 Tax=Alicyclobacillus macrosporangiidus TaxID=392015 RepID=A0A1I7KBU0_9BACL|nr:hypothetical protein [Alicyclobacillus macrosporangiidus]SFU94887.1 hypothetical protein SAMN05421543_11511 [Alicyclobacillus macrosporangiidus]
MPKQPLSVRLPEDLIARLEQSAEVYEGRNDAIERALYRYFRLVDDARRSLRERFSASEICAVMDACNGMMLDRPHLIWAEVADAIRFNHLDSKWEIDGQVLVNKIRELSDVDLYGLEEAIRRFWAHAEEPTEEALRIAFE